MRINKKYAEVIAEWEHLLGGVVGQADLANLANQPKLEAILARAKTLSLQQAEQRAAKQTATKELQGVILEGQDIARDFKAELRSRLGSRAEALVRYFVTPLRTGIRRKSKPAETPTPSPTPGETPAPVPASGAVAKKDA